MVAYFSGDSYLRAISMKPSNEVEGMSFRMSLSMTANSIGLAQGLGESKRVGALCHVKGSKLKSSKTISYKKLVSFNLAESQIWIIFSYNRNYSNTVVAITNFI
jgi:hypothetical protein